MFTMLGIDGSEYGPATVSEIKRWIAQGRADANTQLKRVGEETWIRIGELPEFTGRPPSLPGSSLSPPTDLSLVVDPTAPEAGLDVGACFERSWDLMKSDLGPSLGMTMITLVLSLVFAFIPSTAGALVGCLLTSALYAGYNYYFLLRARGVPAGIAEVFIGFRSAFVPLLLVTLVSGVLVFLGFALFVLPGIYLAVGYAYASLLVVDKKVSFWTALETSRQAVTRQWWQVLALLILFFLVSAMGFIALGIGAIFTVPFATGALVCGYDQLFPREQTSSSS